MSEAGDRRRRVEELFDAALNAAPEAREALLCAGCAGDEELRREVESLLKHDSAETMAALRTPLVGGGRGRVGERVGDVIDRYRLDEVVGEGGFGVVYRAHQSEPVQRDVALKVIKAGMDTRQVVARFEAERQALAMMDHPNVARVLDGGATDASKGGRPYFVMEFVTGLSITAFCDEQALSIEERLGLFGQVCAAVQHAHQKGIVHRDLKPSNVLVHMSDGRAMVKVIDFGIAKAMGPGGDARTMMTEAGQYIGTPEYMSPEQASGGVVDTRTDIYSLGVILYELLAGALPIDVSAARQSGFAAVQRAIVEQSPVRPSTRISGACTAEQARQRGGDESTIRRRLRGDLDWIVMKALEKEPERRYASVSEFAQDIERHLRHEPVLAGPPSVAYRARKFVRRNRVGVAAGAIVVLALAGGGVATTIGFARAVEAEALARQRAEAEAAARASAERRFAQVRELARALTHDVHDAVADIPGSTSARKKIVETGMKYADSLVEEARGDADLAIEVGSAYRRLADVLGKPSVANLGDSPGALEAYRKSSALLGPIASSLAPDSAGLVEYREALFGEAFMLRAAGQTREAIDALRHAGGELEELLVKAPDDPRRRLDVETAYVNMARMQEAVGEHAEALRGYERYKEYLKGVNDPGTRDWMRLSNVATVHLAIGELLKKMGRMEESIATFKEGIEWANRAIEANPTSLRLQGTLAEVNRLMAYAMLDSGKSDEAEAPLRTSAEIWITVSAADPADFRAARNAAIAQYSLGLLEQNRQNWEKSSEYYQRYAEMIEKVAGDNPSYLPAQRDVAIAHESLGLVLGNMGQAARSLEEHRKALAQYERLREIDPNDAQALRDIVGSRRYLAGALHRLAEGKGAAEREALRAESMAMIESSREIIDQMESSGRNAEQMAKLRESLDEVAGRWDESPVETGAGGK